MTSNNNSNNTNNNIGVRWEHRTSFYFASVCAAVGFGNIWRFPALVYKYGGGGIFVLPYLLGVVLIGVPFVVQELALAQHLQQASAVNNQQALNKHTKGVGVSGVLSGLLIALYAMPMVSWCVRAFCESFGHANVTNYYKGNDDDAASTSLSGSNAARYFFHNVIGQYTLDEEQKPTRIVFLNVGYLAVTWILVGVVLRYGGIRSWTTAKTATTTLGGTSETARSYIAYSMLGLPLVLFGMVGLRSLTLPGASYGIHQYFGNWDIAVLWQQPDIWSSAVAQIFVSIGLAFGIMTAFGSYCERTASAVVENSFIIAIVNSVIAIISGVCTCAVLGYMTSEVEGDFRVYAGSALLYGLYPAAFSSIPGGIHWIRFLFLVLILLGLISSFALLEGVITMISESPYVGHSDASKQTVIVVVCCVGFLGGLLYTTDGGLIFADTVDFYINFAVLFLGFCKSLTIGWIYGMKKQVENLDNQWSIVYMYFGTNFSSFFLASLVWFGVKGDTFWLGLICLVVIYCSGIAYCHLKLKQLVNEDTSISMRFLRNELLMGNVEELRSELKSSIGYIPWIWAFLMKHFIPQALLMIFINLFFAETDYGYIAFGNYNGYRNWPYQTVGVLCALFVGIIVAIGVLNSKVYDFLTDPVLLKVTRTSDDKESGWVCGNSRCVDDDDDDDVNDDSVEMKSKVTSNTPYTNMEAVNDSTAIDAVMT